MYKPTMKDIENSKGNNRIHQLKILEMEYRQLLFDNYNGIVDKERLTEVKDILEKHNNTFGFYGR